MTHLAVNFLIILFLLDRLVQTILVINSYSSNWFTLVDVVKGKPTCAEIPHHLLSLLYPSVLWNK